MNRDDVIARYDWLIGGPALETLIKAAEVGIVRKDLDEIARKIVGGPEPEKPQEKFPTPNLS